MRRTTLGIALVVLLTATPVAQQHTSQQVPGAIRSKVVLVPIDVRVLDRAGNPITNLTQSDFTVFEDGKPQQIGHFATQAFEPLAPGSLPPEPVLRRGAGVGEAPVARRTFLFVLGRGRLQYPAKGIDAMRDFLRTRALPQDLIAIQAYGRVTDFTTERAPLLRLLDHYQREHERLEALLDHWFRGPWMFDLEASPGIEKKIAAFFEAPGLPAVRRMAAIDVDGETPYEREIRAQVMARNFARFGRVDPDDVVYDAEGRDEGAKLSAAIDFLRYYEGEKHVVLVTEQGLGGHPSLAVPALAARAADARVTVSIIRTGGVSTSWVAVPRGNGVQMDRAFMGPSPAQLYANADARAIAAETGGLASAYKWASQMIDRIDRATRFQYMLGYYPANTNYDGTKRDIEVVVNRPGATVLHRGSYFGRDDLVPFDQRQFRTHARLTSAAAYRVQMRDIGVEVDGALVEKRQRAWKVRATVTIDPSTIDFVLADGRHVASLDVAIFVGSDGERQIGEEKKRIDLKLEPATLARAKAGGFKYETTIDMTNAPPRYLKAVVYHYATDRLGSAAARIK